MRVVSAYLLAVLGGNANPSADDIKKILGAVGSDADASKIEKLLGELKGKNVEEVIAKGREKLASVPAAGAAPAGGAAAAAAAPAAAAAAPKKEEKKEESDADMGFSLFD